MRGSGRNARSSSSWRNLIRPSFRKFDRRPIFPARPVECGPFAVECRRTIHSVPTFALRVTAGGRVLGFSADSAYDSGLIEWLASADLIVHEATTHAHPGLHTPSEKLAALPGSLRAKMRLTHLPDDFDADSSAIEPLRQGRIYEV